MPGRCGIDGGVDVLFFPSILVIRGFSLEILERWLCRSDFAGVGKILLGLLGLLGLSELSGLPEMLVVGVSRMEQACWARPWAPRREQGSQHTSNRNLQPLATALLLEALLFCLCQESRSSTRQPGLVQLLW